MSKIGTYEFCVLIPTRERTFGFMEMTTTINLYERRRTAEK